MKISGGQIQLTGEVKIPGDKSISHRSIMIGSLAEGKTIVRNFLLGEDCLSTIRSFRNMGVEIKIEEDMVVIEGVGLYGLKRSKQILDVGNSGTTIRLMSGILAGQKFSTTITGDSSIKKRPMDRIITPLRMMGADISSESDKFTPLIIEPVKELKALVYKQPVASAQVKSCILLTGLYCKEETKVIQPSLSRDHTERMLQFFGGDISFNEKEVSIRPGKKLKGREIIVPGDISSAAFFIVGALILKGSYLNIKDIGLNHTRTGMLEILKAMGADIKISNVRLINNEPIGDITVKHSILKGIEIKGDIIPRLIDEIPILAVAAAVAEGTTIIGNAKELKIKESNRIKAMVTELKKMGVSIEELDDGMVINGGKRFRPAQLVTYNDHRIAMALCIASLYADGDSELNETDSINISFPGFLKVIEQLKYKRKL